MAKTLRVTLVQTKLVWENPKQNRDLLTKKLEGLRDTDLIVLPEMFTTGFTMRPEHIAESMDGVTASWMKALAKSKHVAITGSIIIKENKTFYNRLLFVHPDGTTEYYDKRHTFTLAGEDKVYTAGTNRLVVDYKGWTICPLICYDLRFPVWSRNTDDFDMLLYVANWPKPRITAWNTLLKARAIENMCYCIGVNRVGMDSNAHEYSGHSVCYDVLGNPITDMQPHTEQIETVVLEKNHLHNLREKLQFLNDRDTFNLEV